MITLYWAPRTRSGRMFWLLEEIGQPYDLHLVDIRADPRPHDPEFEAASPMAKVPAIRDGDLTVADSAAIALYLADRYASGTLAPRRMIPCAESSCSGCSSCRRRWNQR